MGLGDFSEIPNQSDAERKYRTYPIHEYQDKLDNMVDELQERFPQEVEVDFIEVSPEMTRTWGYTYYKSGGIKYIRIAERLLSKPDEQVKMVVLHEMVHCYMHQIGYGDVSDNDDLFEWVLGRVGAHSSGRPFDADDWKDIAEPFLDM